jgi:hypothetical protein
MVERRVVSDGGFDAAQGEVPDDVGRVAPGEQEALPVPVLVFDEAPLASHEGGPEFERVIGVRTPKLAACFVYRAGLSTKLLPESAAAAGRIPIEHPAIGGEDRLV